MRVSGISTLFLLLHRSAFVQTRVARGTGHVSNANVYSYSANIRKCWICSTQSVGLYGHNPLCQCPATHQARFSTNSHKTTSTLTGASTEQDKKKMASTDAAVSTSDVRTKRLIAVQGFEERTNDVLFTPSSQDPPEGHVIFFGGDIQDYPENMRAQRDNQHYVEWNLENTSAILAKRFPTRHVWIVKPCRMDLKTFSVYSNFVEFTDLCNPENYEGQTSWQHLKALFLNALKRSTEETSPSTPMQDQVDLEGLLDVVLIGFSKGCVVLNQLVYDLGEAKNLDETSNFIRKISQMIWLDGGHNGGSNTWVHEETILHHMAGTGIAVVAHVTPYQVKDPMRKWLGREHRRFVERLRKLGVSVENTVHFADEERSIENHFKVLTLF